MFDSGAYIDLIGKYVHHDNEYTATFAGLGTRDYSTHSWYAGAEAGYRYHVTEDTGLSHRLSWFTVLYPVNSLHGRTGDASFHEGQRLQSADWSYRCGCG
uniref:Autotransporter domain-containing protein n=1 Tax=Escherichia coli TaxID=562 RepID=A0A811ARF7_ECOLX|nr:hypothetical protein [Escherichia coli]